MKLYVSNIAQEKYIDAEKDCITVTEFTDAALSKFRTNFHILHQNRNISVIPVIINSYGGSVHNLLGFIDIIESSQKPVATIVTGKAMSAGATLLACGTKGYRFASKNADIMIHEVSSGTYGKLNDIMIDVKNTKKLNKIVFNILYQKGDKNTKNKLKKLIKDNMNADIYLSAKEMKELGLIDHVEFPQLVKVI